MISGLAAFAQFVAREKLFLQRGCGLNAHVVEGIDIYALHVVVLLEGF